MANIELITCDAAGCKKPFAYRLKCFNLCAEHCFAGDEHPWWWIASELFWKKRKQA